jgi:hypothetical protein
MASLFMPLGIFYMPQIYDMGPTALLPSEGRRAEDFFALKNPTASARFEPVNFGTKGQHATPRPLKLLTEHTLFKEREREIHLRPSAAIISCFYFSSKRC